MSKHKTPGSIGICIGILFLLLGWLVVFAQSNRDFPLPGDLPGRGGFSGPGDFPGRGDFPGPRGFRGRRGPPQLEDLLSSGDSALIDPPFPSGDWEFIFARMVYSGYASQYGSYSWMTDWDKADRQFILGIKRLTNIRIADEGVAVSLTNPDLFKYPFLYSVECGHWMLTEAEIEGLREYLKRGGFLFCDDFWGTREWENFKENMLRVLPEARISDIPMDHPVFHSYYDIEELVMIPAIWIAVSPNPRAEQDVDEPYCRGIFDDHDRLMVIINWNTDLGDAWEWLDRPDLPARMSTYAYQLGINAIIYAMSH